MGGHDPRPAEVPRLSPADSQRDCTAWPENRTALDRCIANQLLEYHRMGRQNMDDITEVYGGHHYANDVAPESLEFYQYFRDKCAAVVNLARSKGKEFILGEFGPAQYLQHKYGVRWDANRWFGTRQEAMGGLQTAEAALAA